MSAKRMAASRNPQQIKYCKFIFVSLRIYSKINRVESTSRTWSYGSTKPFGIESNKDSEKYCFKTFINHHPLF